MAEKVKLSYKKLREHAKVPCYQTPYAAGADLYSCMEETIEIAPGATAFVPTGIAMQIPDGYVGLIYARSGLACKQGLAPANKVGVIDSDYRGEIMVALYNHSAEKKTIADGERIAQMVITPYVMADYEEVDVLEDTTRGAGGFGSTGV